MNPIIIRLAYRSLRSRWVSATLALMAISFSVLLFLGVDNVRHSARSSFSNTISGTDLILGARAGDLQLLLYSVFRIGNATANVTWESIEDIASQPEVDWIVPLSLGDSHRGYRVLGTSLAYFEHYRYRKDQRLGFSSGEKFDDVLDAVIGADVAKSLKYKVGDKIVIAHGLGTKSFLKHDDKPFRVVGILSKTGTPVDRTVHVSLQAIEVIHFGWETGTPNPLAASRPIPADVQSIRPKSVTGALIGVESKLQIFKLQRFINEYKEEPLAAVIPGVALQQLWQLVGTAEVALQTISGLVIVTALLGLITMMMATLNERRREMAVLRAVGASPRTVFGLLLSEALLLTLAGLLLGLVWYYVALSILRPFVDAQYGITLAIAPPTIRQQVVFLIVLASGGLAGVAPAFRAYRQSLVDGMSVRA